jgi:hypothetical protein
VSDAGEEEDEDELEDESEKEDGGAPRTWLGL